MPLGLRQFGFLIGGAALLMAASPAPAADTVDVELILAVDVSLSMSPDELEIQRHGYAAALTDDKVIDAIKDGTNGRIAVSYFEWAGSTSHHVIVPWTIIANRADAERVAARLSAMPPNSARRTSIASALEFATDLFAESPYRGLKRVIDVSGDGSNNRGRDVREARDEAVRAGVIINGLPIVSLEYDLDKYYFNNVIGGPGSFIVPADSYDNFAQAVLRKLILEIASND